MPLRHSPAVRTSLFLLCLWPLFSLTWDIYFDQLGANPVENIERRLGLWALRFICLTLCMTPLVMLLKQPVWASYRRMLGLYSFFYACLHLLSYVWIDYMFDWSDIWHDLTKHRYVYVGFSAWLLMLPLALTSNQWSLARLRQRWKPLHRLVYLIACLAVLHFIWLVKKDISEPLIYALLVLILLGLRMPWVKAQISHFRASVSK
jgi:sulfoxide reductase heme-binding subunit YedZ